MPDEIETENPKVKRLQRYFRALNQLQDVRYREKKAKTMFKRKNGDLLNFNDFGAAAATWLKDFKVQGAAQFDVLELLADAIRNKSDWVKTQRDKFNKLSAKQKTETARGLLETWEAQSKGEMEVDLPQVLDAISGVRSHYETLNADAVKAGKVCA